MLARWSPSPSAPRCSLVPALALALVLGCAIKPIELETDSTSDASTDVTATVGTLTTGPDPDSSGEPGPTERMVDILFVVDNSGSMGEEQRKLVDAIEGLLVVLDGAVPPIDYRIAVTTSDNGNPWCAATAPEAGNFRATSCRSRPTEFVFNGAIAIDAFDLACADVCSLETLSLAEPWVDVQGSTGTTNLGGQSVADALRCMLPQGIDGCGFEQPLESLWKALRRTQTDGEEEYGFLRPGALPAVMIVTDEVDCSHNSMHDSIFLPDGNRVFWSDPDSPSPTSAVCWNAGVACEGGTCIAVNRDVDGNEVTDQNADDDAVLRPVSRYVDILTDVGAYVMAIDGVASDGSVIYQDSAADPSFQSDFGIGPGCESQDGRAVPPVRVREVVGTTSGPGHERSICDGGFENAMATFGQGILSRLP